MPDQPTDGGSFPQDRYRNPEAALGGADAVEKTTYVTGQGNGSVGQPAPGARPSGARSRGGGRGQTALRGANPSGFP